MDYLTVVLSLALNNDVQELRSVSQNLANLSTDGYKREIPHSAAFESLLGVTAGPPSDGPQADSSGGVTGITVARDMRQGALRFSGSAFDVALQGDGFFEIETAGGQRFTRKGNLQIDAQGRLTLSSGEPLVGENGTVYLRSGPFTIDATGVVSQDGFDLDRLRVVRFEDSSQLNYLGEGLYAAGSFSALRPLPFSGQVMQGYQESSNVRSTDEIIRLIELTRHFETTQRVLQGYDGMLDQAINSLGDL